MHGHHAFNEQERPSPAPLQEEREAMGAEAWGNGLARNRKNLERFIQYELDQGLIG